MMNCRQHLRTVVNEDGAAILDTKLGSITTLNSTGAFVWQGLEQGDSIENIVARLSRDAGVTCEIVERDVFELVEALRAQQLLS